MPGSSKYGPYGMYSAETFRDLEVPECTKELLAETANFALAKSTWSTYRTVFKHLQTCMEDSDRQVVLPLSEADVLTFTSWLLVKRGVRGATVDAYLSALRQVHLVKGVEPPKARPEIVKMIVTGAKHRDAAADRTTGRPIRLPVTVDMLNLIKLKLSEMKIPMQRKRLYWAVCALNFFGGFRVHETLSRCESQFDPAFCLLGRDIELRQITVGDKHEEIIQLKLKSPKEDRVGAGCTFVDVYTTGGLLCPVRAFKKWMLTGPPADPDLPAFREEDGVPLTGRKLNKILRGCLEDSIPYDTGFVTSHSFRSGIASLMGQLGYTDDQIKAIGRWSSAAIERYLKLPRTKRAAMAKEIGKLRL